MYGSPDGLSSDGDTLLYQGHDGLYDWPEDYDKFGYSLAAGYFNANNYEDLAIGAPQEDYFGADAGVVHVVWGYVGAISTDSDLLLDQEWISGQSHDADDLFGWALAAGDFNGDGNDDLAVGVPGEDISTYNQAGTVHVLYGSFSYIADDFTQDHPFLSFDDDQWGYSLAAGDFNADGYDDLLVGTPLHDWSYTVTNAGAVGSMLGSEDGVDATTHWLAYISHLGGSLQQEQGDQFGYALVVLDEPHTLIEFLYLPVVSK